MRPAGARIRGGNPAGGGFTVFVGDVVGLFPGFQPGQVSEKGKGVAAQKQGLRLVLGPGVQAGADLVAQPLDPLHEDGMGGGGVGPSNKAGQWRVGQLYGLGDQLARHFHFVQHRAAQPLASLFQRREQAESAFLKRAFEKPFEFHARPFRSFPRPGQAAGPGQVLAHPAPSGKPRPGSGTAQEIRSRGKGDWIAPDTLRNPYPLRRELSDLITPLLGGVAYPLHGIWTALHWTMMFHSQVAEYLADARASAVAGHANSLRAMDILILAPETRRAVLGIGIEKRPEGGWIFDHIASEMRAVPPERAEAYRRGSEREQASRRRSHPPTAARQAFLQGLPEVAPKIVLGAPEAAAIAAEIAPHKERAGAGLVRTLKSRR